jgi:dsDNA-specific endonuclease/ATPase MutS2
MAKMLFSLGADVVVLALQKKGRIVEIGAHGRYRVAIGGVTAWCREADLAPVSHSRGEARREKAAASRPRAETVGTHTVTPTPGEARALGSLDLHGLTVPEALHALEERLDRAIRAGLDRLEIIHGISGGRLRAVVRGYLAGVTGIARFEADPRNPGVTWVYF